MPPDEREENNMTLAQILVIAVTTAICVLVGGWLVSKMMEEDQRQRELESKMCISKI